MTQRTDRTQDFYSPYTLRKHRYLALIKAGNLHERHFQNANIEVTQPARSPCGNRLIDALPPRQRANLIAQCELVPMKFGSHLADKAHRIRYVYFPLTGFASLVIVIDEHMPLELNIIGNEGMLGAEMVLNTRIAPYTSVVQGSGTSLSLRASAFASLLDSSVDLRKICNRYFYVLVEQLAQSIACNCFHEVAKRLARWILMTHDRAHCNELRLTHAFLATMLGVRRSAVTIAAGELQQQRLIRYSRGRIRILSRSGLEKRACECYAAGVRAYETGLKLEAENSLR